MHLPDIRIELPSWIAEGVRWTHRYTSDEDKVRLAVELARRNVLEQTGGPFGAAVFEEESGRLVAVGVNMVVPANNSVLHAEMVAFMTAQARVGSYSLRRTDWPPHTLATSCDPCAMCLGATLWSGVDRVLCGAQREDAEAFSFDEGPVFPASFQYLEDRGIEITRGICREEAAAVLELYADRSGIVYNG